MSIFESNTVVLHGVTAESRKIIHSFLQGYLDLFEKHFGEDKMDGYIYIGGIPTYAFDLDMDYGPFPREEGYYVMGISPRWAKGRYWGTNPGFFGIFLEQKLCTKITWHQYWDQGEPNRIYMNDSTENVPSSWKYYEFVPGENDVPAEYDEENEDDGEAFNQYVNEVMKGELEVEWKDGFPDYWQDKYDELISQRINERMDDMDLDFGDYKDGEKDVEEFDFNVISKVKETAAQNERSMRLMHEHLQKKLEQAQDQLNARQRKFDRAMKSKMDEIGGALSGRKPSNSPSDSPFDRQSEDRICPGCHSPVAKNDRFCENCGHKL